MSNKVFNNINEAIGHTPLVKLNRLTDDNMADVYVKLEFMNPGSSVKDRIALAMIEAAEEAGKLTKDTTIVEPTSGNTGIGLAMGAASKGYKAVLVMPDTMSKERRNLLKAYGAELVLTPGADGMKGAIKKANELVEQAKSAGFTIDAFIAGVGTGGTVTGVGHVLKENNPNTKVYALEPSDSPVLSGGESGPHKLQGLGAGFVPDTLDTEVYDGIV